MPELTSNRNSQTSASSPSNIRWSKSKVTMQDRATRLGQRGCVVWFTGLPGAGKSTLAVELEWQLFNRGNHVVLLDGDNLRHGLCADLKFSAGDRRENIRRVAEVAKLFADSGMIVIAALISPLRADREAARARIGEDRFFEIFVNSPIQVCEQRDPKGLYAKARAGLVQEFTGVSAPYEAPENPTLELKTDLLTVQQCIARLIEALPFSIERRATRSNSHGKPAAYSAA